MGRQQPINGTGTAEPALVRLSGQIERITYANMENGFTIARARVAGNRDEVTVVGHLMAPSPGTVLHMEGTWQEHPRFGRQFKVERFEAGMPATQVGIRKYLGSGMIKGLGPTIAGRIVAVFGDDTLTVIDTDIDRLRRVPGIGQKRIEQIRKAWRDQKEIRQVMIFLQAHEVSTAYAVRIFKQYGQATIATITENPYRLAADIFGIGFVSADKIAAKLGFEKDSPVRLQAGILYVLYQLSDKGHVYYPKDGLIDESRKILQTETGPIESALATIADAGQVVIETIDAVCSHDTGPVQAVFPARLHLCETRSARRLAFLARTPTRRSDLNWPRSLSWVQQRLGLKLADRQAEAVRTALTSKLMVITGGPGTGKTTIIHAIIRLYARLGARIKLAAPTGRAAKRMSEATGRAAVTLHRLLEFTPGQTGFQRNEDQPLECDLLIVDEASMIDVVLMHHLLKAVPNDATFILVGDVNQLPSVGPGSVLGDLIGSAAVPVVRLDKIFRQASSSRIVVNAHRVQHGDMPHTRPPADGTATDFYFIEQQAPEKILEIILTATTRRIPARFDLDPVDDIQVLSPMHRGLVGAANLNRELQRVLNPAQDLIVRGDRSYRLNDKVMQIRNNYDKDVFNGDIGRITTINTVDQTVTITFDGRPVDYDFSDLDETVLAYAVSVHKAQGSEYPAVVIPVTTAHYVLLQRNLIYTAMTRARQLVVMVGTRKALAMAIHNDRPQHRFTHLRQRIADALT